jgi:Cu2+-exporting ATPase
VPPPAAITCYHCGLPVPSGASWRVAIAGIDRAVCCPGCEAVARVIVDSGLTDYYRYREGPAVNPANLGRFPVDLQEYDRLSLREEIVRPLEGRRKALTLALEGLRCSACCWLIESRLRALPGVREARVSLTSERCDIEWHDVEHVPSEFVEEISRLGYRAYPYRPDERAAHRDIERRRSLIRLGIAGLASMQVMMFATSLYAGSLQGMAETYRLFLRWVSAVVTLPVVLVSARPFFEGARRDLGNYRLGMDVPVTLAIVAAFVASLYQTLTGGAEVYFDSVCMFVFFLLIGRHFEASARRRASQSVENALRSPPAMATRVGVDGELEVVGVRELGIGDRLLVKPGETFPADAVVREGSGAVDEAMLSGEHWPREKRVGDAVLGGSVNVESTLVVDVTRLGEESALAAIVRLVERAGSARPAVAEMADRVAAAFVPLVIACALAAAWWWWPTDPRRGFNAALAVLVVTCPCALSLATPAALAAASGGMLRRGFLIASSHVLETLATATHVVFDKTGTLTQGRLRLGRCLTVGPVGESECRRMASALESRSEHPIARAFPDVASLDAHALDLHDVRNVAGKGVEGRFDTRLARIGVPEWAGELVASGSEYEAPGEDGWILLADESGALCWFEITDSMRPEAAATVRDLQARRLRVEVVSGDRDATVRKLAERLGVATAVGGASAAQKLTHVRGIQDRGGVVVMVGDGVNDAPGLGGAHVSVAMGGGTDLAMSRADSVLLRENLDGLVEAVDHARKTRRVIAQNLVWASLYNVVAVPLAAAGLIPPYWAAAGMSASSLLVVGNAVRLGSGRPLGKVREQARASVPAPTVARATT